MKNNILSWLFLLLPTLLAAQSVDEKKYLLTSKTKTVGLSTLNILDPYLSPLNYNGLSIRYNHEGSKFLSVENRKFSLQNKFDFVGGLAFNPAISASMTYMGFNYQFGPLYHFEPIYGFKLMAGGSWDIDFGYKMITRNVNNPVNVDLATNLNFSGLAIYDIRFLKRKLGLQLSVQSPLFGYMYVPRQGASYYEMFDLWNLSDVAHFSSLHNKRGINTTFTVDVPFKFSTFQLGMGYRGLKYTANDLVFKRNEMTVIIGTRFDIIKFAGRNNKAPRNFISTND